jgi:hypothetical protein
MKKMESVLMLIIVSLIFGIAGCGTAPSPTPPEMVSLEAPLWIIGGENQVEGFMDFREEMQVIYQGTSAVSGYPLVEGIERHLEDIRKCNSILIIPPILEGIQEFRDLDDKYPDLCPLSCDELESELESHSSPLLYFSQDIEDDKIRGIIVAEEVDPSLAELLSEDVPLDTPFRYENGQLEIL